MPPLSEREKDQFLNERGILLRIATTRKDGSPAVTPIWFLHEAGAIYFTPREKSVWLAHLRRDPRVALCIDEQPLPYRKVIVRGSAESVYDVGADDEWRDLYRRITRRYVDDEAAENYIQATIDQPRALLRVVLSDSEVQTWRMPTGEEDASGIWHRRYYAEGSQLEE